MRLPRCRHGRASATACARRWRADAGASCGARSAGPELGRAGLARAEREAAVDGSGAKRAAERALASSHACVPLGAERMVHAEVFLCEPPRATVVDWHGAVC